MSQLPYSLTNPPSAPKKGTRKAECEIPLEWRDRVRRNLSREFVEEERRSHLREVEKVIKARRQQRQREADERFLWLQPDYKLPELDGPFRLDDGTIIYL